MSVSVHSIFDILSFWECLSVSFRSISVFLLIYKTLFVSYFLNICLSLVLILSFYYCSIFSVSLSLSYSLKLIVSVSFFSNYINLFSQCLTVSYSLYLCLYLSLYISLSLCLWPPLGHPLVSSSTCSPAGGWTRSACTVIELKIIFLTYLKRYRYFLVLNAV